MRNSRIQSVEYVDETGVGPGRIHLSTVNSRRILGLADAFVQSNDRLASKRKLSKHQRIQRDAHGPDIGWDARQISFSQSDVFRGIKSRRACRALHLVVSFGKYLGHAKIYNLYNTVGSDEHVVGLDVAMCNLVLVD